MGKAPQMFGGVMTADLQKQALGPTDDPRILGEPDGLAPSYKYTQSDAVASVPLMHCYPTGVSEDAADFVRACTASGPVPSYFVLSQQPHVGLTQTRLQGGVDDFSSTLTHTNYRLEAPVANCSSPCQHKRDVFMIAYNASCETLTLLYTPTNLAPHDVHFTTFAP